MSLFFELCVTVEDFTSKLGLMKCTEAADDVKLEVDTLLFLLLLSVKTILSIKVLSKIQ